MSADENATPQDPIRRFDVRSYDKIKRERVELLLPDEPPMPLGTLSIVAGLQGLGKSLWVDRLTARVTRAGFGVILIGDEDAAATVTKPRLEAAGADLARVFEMYAPEDPWLGVRLPRDADELRTLAEQVGARLVVIDPWTNHLDGVNPNRGEEVRAALRPILAAARDVGFVLKVVAHLNKSNESDPLQRIAHSGAISQLARAAFLMGRDPEHEQEDPDAPNPYRILAHVKANLTETARSRRYRITTVELAATGLEPAVVTARLDDDGYASTSGEDLLNSDATEAPAQRGALDLLRQMTAAGPAPVEDVKRAAKSMGVSERSLQRAAQRFGYRAKPEGFGSGWVYVSPTSTRPRHPGESAETDETGSTRNGGNPHSSTVSPVSPSSPTSPVPPTSPPTHNNTHERESERENGSSGHVGADAYRPAQPRFEDDQYWADMNDAEATA